MTTIGFIGAGSIGGTVARLAVDAGYDVVLANSRGPETLADLVADLGPRARADTAERAAAAGDIVVVTVPLKAYKQVPVVPLAGKVVLDTNNYYPDRDGRIPELDAKETTSSALLQAHLPQSHVVKVFNNVYFKALASLPRPQGAADRSALAIAGDDPAAKQTAVQVLDALGYDTYDVGSLADSWRFEPGAPAYGAPYAVDGDYATPRPAGVAVIRDAVAQATR